MGIAMEPSAFAHCYCASLHVLLYWWVYCKCLNSILVGVYWCVSAFLARAPVLVYTFACEYYILVYACVCVYVP